MRLLRYLIACAVAGALLGRAYGVFSRSPFHYPLRRDLVSWWHRTLLEGLDVTEWPGLFFLTLAASMGLWHWLGPRVGRPLAAGGVVAMVLTGFLATTAAFFDVPGLSLPGRTVAGLIAAILGAPVGALLVSLWNEACAASGTVWPRWLAQVPLLGGHLAATSTAALSMGYRGESALIHGIALLIGIGIFAFELAVAVPIARVACRRDRTGYR